jgi:hypothetical protein
LKGVLPRFFLEANEPRRFAWFQFFLSFDSEKTSHFLENQPVSNLPLKRQGLRKEEAKGFTLYSSTRRFCIFCGESVERRMERDVSLRSYQLP